MQLTVTCWRARAMGLKELWTVGFASRVEPTPGVCVPDKSCLRLGARHCDAWVLFSAPRGEIGGSANIPGVLPSEFTPVSRTMHSMWSPSAMAWLRVLRKMAEKPSPLVYPSAAASHMKDRPLGDSMLSLRIIRQLEFVLGFLGAGVWYNKPWIRSRMAQVQV
jgi:hypothetical protein